MNKITNQTNISMSTRIKCYAVLFTTMFLLGSIQTTKGLVLSQVQHDIDISLTMIGSLLSIFQVAFTAAAIITGYMTDKKGVRFMILVGSLFMVIGLLGTGFSNTVFFFLGFYSIIGLGIGSMLTAICSVIPKVFAKEASTLFNIGNAMFGVGLIVAPLLLNYISSHDHSWRMFYYLITAAVVIIMVTIASVELEKTGNNNNLTIKDAILVLKDQKVCLLLAFFVFYVATEASFFNFLPIFIQNNDIGQMSLEQKTEMAGTILAAFGFVFTICRFLGGWITNKLGESNTLIIFSFIATASLILGTIYIENAMVFFMAFGVGLSLLWTTAQTIISRGTDKEGTVIGLTYMAAGIGGTTSGILIGGVSDHLGINTGFVSICILASITLFIAIAARKIK